MLKNLYKKLHVLFVTSVMLIITIVIGILFANDVRTESINDSTLFQRMATLMIYQLEDNNQNIKSVIRSYEEKYAIFCLAQDNEGIVLYQSELVFPTETETLLGKFNRQMDMQLTQTVTHSSMSEQNGIVEITGDFHEKYWGISATAISRNETLYHL